MLDFFIYYQADFSFPFFPFYHPCIKRILLKIYYTCKKPIVVVLFSFNGRYNGTSPEHCCL